jgi:hypothetical protein
MQASIPRVVMPQVVMPQVVMPLVVMLQVVMPQVTMLQLAMPQVTMLQLAMPQVAMEVQAPHVTRPDSLRRPRKEGCSLVLRKRTIMVFPQVQ